ncbi:GNAT family N-acetyltransferase [Ornithinicoccus halotolerans]|uniref:GNAT family N-acetyltransferase n=1 Tax=Ornithinicoccus halotolerans TaxID=1748220 RepID=UPI00129567B6|nr:GNAT family N-acetyltransferase [Ornithinicoccus halotolerans]
MTTTTATNVPCSTAAAVTIRRATPADAAAVHALVLAIAELEGDLEHVQVTVEGWQDLLGRDDVTVLLAEQRGHALGYVSATRRLHLWSGTELLAVDDVFVREHARGYGLGRQLLIAMAGTVAAEELLVVWGMEPDNTGAQRFYRRLGATLRPKVLAGWAPAAYLPLVHGENSEENR